MTTRTNQTTVPGFSVIRSASPELAGRTAARLFTTPRRHERPLRERALLTAALPFRLTAANQRLAAWAWGAASAPAVLLVHGWEGRGSQLASFVEPLVSRGLRVVAFDAPGHGDSPGEQLTLAGLADIVTAVAASVGPLHGIVAHSLGASAVTLALSRGLSVDRVVFVAPAVSATAAVSYFANHVGLSPVARRIFEQRLIALNGAPAEQLDALRLAPSMTAPLLVVHDRDDAETPLAGANALAVAWPGAEIRATTGLGHRRILRDDAVAAAIATFVGGTAPPRSDADWITRDLWDRESRRRRAFP